MKDAVIRLRQESFLGPEWHARQIFLTTLAQTTKHIGDFWEEAGCNLVGGQRTRVLSGVNCPDVIFGDGRYLEAKSVGKNRQVILSKDQLYRYAELQTVFTLWVHDLRFPNPFQPLTLDEMRKRLSVSLNEIIAIEAKRLIDIIGDNWKDIPYCLSNNRGRSTFRGIRLPIRHLRQTSQPVMSFEIRAYSETITSVPVHTYMGENFPCFLLKSS